MTGVRRVIVGASGSPGSLRALRYADELARAHDATLIPVLTWLPPGGELADRRSPGGYLRRICREDACERLRDALIAVWGEVPDDPPVHPLVHRARLAGFWSVWLAALMTCWLWVLAVVVRWPGWSLDR